LGKRKTSLVSGTHGYMVVVLKNKHLSCFIF
jgi:hypothetical protein